MDELGTGGQKAQHDHQNRTELEGNDALVVVHPLQLLGEPLQTNRASQSDEPGKAQRSVGQDDIDRAAAPQGGWSAREAAHHRNT